MTCILAHPIHALSISYTVTNNPAFCMSTCYTCSTTYAEKRSTFMLCADRTTSGHLLMKYLTHFLALCEAACDTCSTACIAHWHTFRRIAPDYSLHAADHQSHFDKLVMKRKLQDDSGNVHESMYDYIWLDMHHIPTWTHVKCILGILHMQKQHNSLVNSSY